MYAIISARMVYQGNTQFYCWCGPSDCDIGVAIVKACAKMLRFNVLTVHTNPCLLRLQGKELQADICASTARHACVHLAHV